jgi:hypothetical protein
LDWAEDGPERHFIARAVQDAFGDDWITRQTPTAMKDAWEGKWQAADKGEENRSLIEYAGFTKLQGDHRARRQLEDVFKPIFRRPEDIRESFQRLFPIRIRTMHARIITLDDELLLMSQMMRVLRAARSPAEFAGVECAKRRGSARSAERGAKRGRRFLLDTAGPELDRRARPSSVRAGPEAPQRNRNELSESTMNKTRRKHLSQREKSTT